jgi:opacity protein-like surface antigen
MKPFVLIIVFLCSFSIAAQPYARAGIGVETAGDATLLDRDCASTNPPALFGCGAGPDGAPFSARGKVDSGAAFELALGHERGRTRAEVLLTSRSGFELDAQSNFTGVVGNQPVSAGLRSLSLMLAGVVDLAPERWCIRPFVTAGAGVARNEMGRVLFTFPGIGPNAVTVTRGGSATGFAWTAGAGVTIALTNGLSIDVTARHTDLGEIHGDAGEATIVRPTRTLRLDIAATEMEWQTRGLSVLVRQRF